MFAITTANIILTVCSVITTVLAVLYFYVPVFGAVGLFATKKFSPARKNHKYAVLISARNEENVIGNLLESIRMQDYPKELITVFVVADNCTDRTAEIAREYGAVCYERFDGEHCTKGYALQFLLDKIEEDYGRLSFEGYYIFDADNLLCPDYFTKMNDAFDSGEKIVTAYRNSKNIDTNWISAAYSLHFLRTARFEARGRSFVKVPIRLQGTGYLFDSSLVKDGWDYVRLTEDRAFSSWAVANGIHISYQYDAVFYDEQPTDIKIAMRQRIRWAKGHLQSFTETFSTLVGGIIHKKTFLKKFACYDMLMMNFPNAAVLVLPQLLSFTLGIIKNFSQGGELWSIMLKSILDLLWMLHISMIPVAALILLLERKRIKKIKWYKKIFFCLVYPAFDIMGTVAIVIALFTDVTWKPIPHSENVKINEIMLK